MCIIHHLARLVVKLTVNTPFNSHCTNQGIFLFNMKGTQIWPALVLWVCSVESYAGPYSLVVCWRRCSTSNLHSEISSVIHNVHLTQRFLGSL